MLPPSLALAWTIWRQHGIGFVLMLVYVLGGSVLSALLPAYCTQSVAHGAIGLLAVPLNLLFLAVLIIFTYGLDGGDLLARESCFPARLFRLPIPTGALVLWPMVFGAVAVALLWLVSAAWILQPWLRLLDDRVALWWPALLGIAALAWVQALFWSPFGLAWVRLVLLGALAPVLMVLATWGVESGVSEALLAGVFAGLTAVAWTIGYAGVKQARHGMVPDWDWMVRPVRRLARFLPRRRHAFASAATAQRWFEWRLHGLSLPIMTALVLPIGLWPLALGKNDVISTEQTLLSALGIPVFLAGMFGARGGGYSTGVKDRFGLGPFNATLPMSTAGMVAAILKSAALSTLATWLIVALMLPSAVIRTGNLAEVASWWTNITPAHHPLKLTSGILAVATLLIVWTWKRQVDRLYFGLTGRQWVSTAVALMCFPGSVMLIVVAGWLIQRPEWHPTVLNVLPWLLGLVIVCRLLLAGWALRHVLRFGLLAPSALARWLASWLLVAVTLFAVLAWTVPSLLPVQYLAFAVLFAMPMARLAAAPLALAWNRHR